MPQNGPKMAQSGPNMTQIGPNMTQHGPRMGDLLQAKPCLWRDGSAEQGGVVVIEGLEGGVVGRGVTRTWFPARKKSQELQQFRLYFTGSSGILKK